MFNLLVNYRSHRGITNVAAELVSILSSLFPNAIDPLEREHGIVEGTLPLIFDGFQQSNDLRVESFLFGAGDTTMEFGELGWIKVTLFLLTKLLPQVPSNVG